MLITIDKEQVMAEVGLATAYAEGANTTRATVAEDACLLERFWQESRAAAMAELRPYYPSEQMAGSTLRITLCPMGTFSPEQLPALEASLHGYFVAAIAARWKEATASPAYAKQASDSLQTALQALGKKTTRRRLPEI